MQPVRKPAIAAAAPAAAQPARPTPRKAPAPVSSAAALQSRIGAVGMRQMVERPRGAKPPPRAAAKPPERSVKKAPARSGGKGPAPAPAKAGVAAAGTGKMAVAAPAKNAAMAGGGSAAADAPAVRLHMPPPPRRPSPATMRRIEKVEARADDKAVAHVDLPVGETQVENAQNVVKAAPPAAETDAKAMAALIVEFKAAPSPRIVELCQHIRKVIEEQRPDDEDELMEADPEAAAEEAGKGLNAIVVDETGKVADNYTELNAGPAANPPPVVPDLPAQPPLATTPPLNAQAGTPDAVPAANVSLDKDAEESRKKAQDAGMDSPAAQLVQSGPVAEARAAQGELDQVAREGPAEALARQEKALAQAEAGMASLGAKALAVLTASRETTVSGNEKRQHGMVASEESMRAHAGTEAKKAFAVAQEAVEGLIKFPEAATKKWEVAKAGLVRKFKADLAKVQEYIDERHSGAGGKVLAAVDYFVGLPIWVTIAYAMAEDEFADGVIEALTTISTEVDALIKSCDAIIESTRTRIAKIYEDLPPTLASWAEGERKKFDVELDTLHNRAHAARDNFEKGLKEEASQAVDDVRTELTALRKKASGLVGRIVAAVGRFLDDPVKFIIDGLLDLLGISPAAFWAVVAKIKKYVSAIADDPLGFGENLLAGLGQGFSRFFDNFGTHMITGFLTWLLGDLKGVQLPKSLSLASIASFFFQLMGITWPNIRKIIADKIGAKNLALIEKVWSMVSLLIEKGPEGIVEMIADKLDPQTIVDQVIEMAVDYMVTAIMKQVAVRLLLLFNPVGAILQALEAIYRVLKWVFQNAAKIFKLVETVVDGIGDIIAGNIAGFAGAVEKGLAMLIPPVIAFIADYFSLGDLPKVVAEQVKSMQKWVLGLIAQALDWLIEKGKALLASMGIGKKKEEKKEGGAFDGKVGDTVSWKAEDESHELWIEDVGGQPEAMMASADKGPVKKKLKEYAAQTKSLKGRGTADRKARAEDAITQATGILDGTIAAAKATKAAAADPNAKPADVKAKDDATESWEDKLWPQLQIIQIALRLIPLPKTQIRGSGAKASTVVAEPLTKIGDTGTTPRGKMKGWDHVCRVDRAELNPKKGQWGPAFWVRGHLVSDWLHGPGDPWNTVPLRKVDNGAMEREIERDAWLRTLEEEVLTYTATVTYFDGPIVEDFPNSITITWGSLRFDKGKWVPGEDFAPFHLQPEPPPLEGGLAPDINSLGLSSLYKLDVPFRFAEAMVKERKARGKFTRSDFEPRMKAIYATRAGAAEANRDEGLKAVEALIGDDKIAFPN